MVLRGSGGLPCALARPLVVGDRGGVGDRGVPEEEMPRRATRADVHVEPLAHW